MRRLGGTAIQDPWRSPLKATPAGDGMLSLVGARLPDARSGSRAAWGRNKR